MTNSSSVIAVAVVLYLAGCGFCEDQNHRPVDRDLEEQKRKSPQADSDKRKLGPLERDFEKGTPVWRLYQEMKQHGIEDADLDQGYPRIDFLKKNHRLVHHRDGVVQTEEVLGYALKRYQRYGPIIQQTMGYEIPWVLDDLDPKTSFDRTIREKVGSAISAIERDLAAHGYKSESNRRDELLAISLFAFALAPPESGAGTPAAVEDELRSAKLLGVLEYLDKKGGLGRMAVKEDCILEANALQALEKKCGKCSEDSKILFALFRMAGLRARLAYGKIAYSALAEMERSPGYLHFSIGLTLSDKTRFFDMINRTADAEPLFRQNLDWWFPCTNREALSLHYAGRCIRYVKISKPDLAIEECEKALELHPYSFVAFMNLGTAQQQKSRLELAAANYKRALRIHPDYAEAYYNLGIIAFRRQEVDRAIGLFGKALRLYPGFAEARRNLEAIVGGEVANLPLSPER